MVKTHKTGLVSGEQKGGHNYISVKRDKIEDWIILGFKINTKKQKL